MKIAGLASLAGGLILLFGIKVTVALFLIMLGIFLLCGVGRSRTTEKEGGKDQCDEAEDSIL